MEKFDGKYRDLLNSHQESAPEQGWEQISFHLDTDEVWSRIDRRLSRETRDRNIRAVASLSLLLLLLSFPAYHFFHSGREGAALLPYRIFAGGSLYTAAINEPADKNTISSFNETPSIVRSDVKPFQRVHVVEHSGPDDAPVSGIGVKVTSHDANREPAMLMQIITEEVDNPSIVDEITVSVHDTDYFFRISPQELYRPPGFRMGLQAFAGSPWILNRKTFSGFSGKGLDQSHFCLGKAFGLSLSYAGKKGMTYGLGWFRNMTYEQERSYYDEGTRVTDELLLRYQSLHLAAGKSKRILPASRFEFYRVLSAGAGVHILSGASRNINGAGTSPPAFYRDLSFSFLLRFDMEMNFSDRFSGHAGIVADIGFSNIVRDSPGRPALFDKTYTAGAGFTLGLAYRLSKK